MTSRFITTVTGWHSLLSDLKASRWIIVVDETSKELCLPLFQKKYTLPSESDIVCIPAGEHNKTLDTAQLLWTAFSELNVDRKSIVICIGGGTVSDLSGFAAATFKRGLRTINVPTTLLSMCDAAIGGKTGINYSGIKNLVGVIHVPEAVLIEPEFLDTLPERELHYGFAETIKHALIADEIFWNEIRVNSLKEAVYNRSFILRSSRIKRHIVDLDLHDRGTRQGLNFGHTVGHGAEALSLSHAHPMHHGEAIIFGLVAELWLSVQLAGLDERVMGMAVDWMKNQYRMTSIAEIDPEACILRMRQDKKNDDNQIVCTLLRSIGSPVIGVPVNENLLIESIRFAKTQLAS